MSKSGRQEAGTLVYAPHQLTPQDLLNFCEMQGFIQDWGALHLGVEFDLLALQVGIMANPRSGNLIRGTGGLRKLEFTPPHGLGGKKRGKRNSCRVCYVYFEEFHTVLLVAAYAKGRKEDLTENEKTIFKQAIAKIHEHLSSRYVKQDQPERS